MLRWTMPMWGRFTTMIKKFSKDTQFIIITHNKKHHGEIGSALWRDHARDRGQQTGSREDGRRSGLNTRFGSDVHPIRTAHKRIRV